MTPLVTIVIPCYNAERYIGDAIRSALTQSYAEREVVVIDDGSTDGSLDVIRSFGSAVRFESGRNRGGGAARNRAIELSDGELIQFLDADDLLHRDKLRRQVGAAIGQEKSLLFCDGEFVDVDLGGQIGSFRRSFDLQDDAVCYMLRGGLPTPAPLHWKKNLMAVGGFRKELPCSQERDLHLRLACHGLTFHHLPETLYTVRRVPGSLSGNSIRVLDQRSDIAWCAYRLLEELGGLTGQRRAVLAGFLASGARAYLQYGFSEKAGEYFAQAARIHPDGGIPQAYSKRTRWLYRLLGPAATQRLVAWRRTMSSYPSA